MNIIRLALLTLIGFCAIIHVSAQSATHSRGLTLLHIRPQHYLLGAHLGIETALSDKWSFGLDATTHFWWVPTNISLAPSFRWYFAGSVGCGFFLRVKGVGGHFFYEDRVGSQPYYAGGGLNLGGVTPIFGTKRLGMFFDGGLSFVAPLGKTRLIGSDSRGDGFMVYYAMLSPAALLNASVGLFIRL